MRTIKQTLHFKATPHEVYETLIDEKKHAQFTHASASISRKIRGKYSVYDGWIKGENLELIQDKKIIQTWVANDPEWKKDHVSKVTFELEKTPDGTQLTLTHENIPDDWYEDISKGWNEYYWKPMKAMLERK